jgi:phytol kinase
VNDLLAIVCFSLVFILLLGTAEWLNRRWGVEPEVARKTAHLSCGLVAAAMPLFMSFGAIALVAILFMPFMVISRRLELFPAVQRAERSTLGDLYFPLGVLIVAVAFPTSLIYTFGVLVMAVSDAVAGLLGERFGHRGYRLFGAWKTYVGSGAFFATTLILAGITLAVDGAALPTLVLSGLFIALTLTLVEGVFGGGLDNVVLPAASAGILTLVT